jgi:hypothetical protein
MQHAACNGNKVTTPSVRIRSAWSLGTWHHPLQDRRPKVIRGWSSSFDVWNVVGVIFRECHVVPCHGLWIPHVYNSWYCWFYHGIFDCCQGIRYSIPSSGTSPLKFSLVKYGVRKYQNTFQRAYWTFPLVLTADRWYRNQCLLLSVQSRTQF